MNNLNSYVEQSEDLARVPQESTLASPERAPRALTFEYEGEHYRIAFVHDRPQSLAWAAHRTHEVALQPEIQGGPVVLWCVPCHMKLAPVSKKSVSARKTVCKIQSNTAGPDERPVWRTVFSAVGRPNLKAGDQFCRAAGREAALTNTLNTRSVGGTKVVPKAFRIAAWAAYSGRLAMKVARAGAAV